MCSVTYTDNADPNQQHSYKRAQPSIEREREVKRIKNMTELKVDK